MGFYSCSTIPVIRTSAINSNGSSTAIKQVWYADDAAGGGKIEDLKLWWGNLCSRGPLFGYYPKPSKTWVILKQQHYEAAKKAFPGLKITTAGHKYLGSFIGTTEGKEAFVSDKVTEWCKDLKQLSEIASREPQVAYSAFIYGLSKRWTYVCRTTPEISELLKPLEHSIQELFIPAILDRVFSCTDILRQVFSLPQRDGGLGIFNMTEVSDAEYGFSIRATKQLAEAIYCQDTEYQENEEELHDIKQNIRKERAAFYKEKQEKLLSEVTELGRLMINLASEKGASSWLTALPLKDFGYVLNKQQFADALALRYSFYLKDCPKMCACGETNSINHALICKTGGYVSMRHNWLRNCIGKIMETAKCKDIQLEPSLLPTNGYQLPPGTITGDQSRLDISARSVWNVLERAFFDVRVFHAPAPTNMNKPIPRMYLAHENEKKRSYNARVIQVEKGTFTPLVFSTTGGAGIEAQRLIKKLAQQMEYSTGQKKADAIGFIRKRLRFELLKTTVIALRGYRGKKKVDESKNIDEIDLNLEPTI